VPDQQQETVEKAPEGSPGYEAPIVEDLDSADGPAVTAAGLTKT